MTMNVAIFTPELPITEDIPHYSGGLGILFFKCFEAAARAELDLTFITLLYRHGYYKQGATNAGMTINYQSYQYEDLIERGLVNRGLVSIPFGNNTAYLRVWEQPADIADNARALFLDADIPENDELTRRNTLFLYGGHSVGYTIETRIAQSVLLARGGLRALNYVGIKPDIFHVNESHGAFVGMERLLAILRMGYSFAEALQKVRKRTLFTTHTPVSAGNPTYSMGQVEKIAWYPSTVLSQIPLVWGDRVNMAALGYFFSGITNAVSAKHLRVTKDLLGWIPDNRQLCFVTNGQNRSFWQHEDFCTISSIEDLKDKKKSRKQALIQYVRNVAKKSWGENVFTVVCAGRIAEYKRKGLITHDKTWLHEQLEGNRLQIIISGKPHPDDQQMIDEWNKLYHLSRQYNNLAVIPGYEIPRMKLYKEGADAWINTPRAPYEACGTAGMGAAFNGTVNISTPDGWYCETDSSAFFLFGSDGVQAGDQDTFDQRALIKCVEEVTDLYYRNPKQFYQKALEAKEVVERRFTTERMLCDYAGLYQRLAQE